MRDGTYTCSNVEGESAEDSTSGLITCRCQWFLIYLCPIPKSLDLNDFYHIKSRKVGYSRGKN